MYNQFRSVTNQNLADPRQGAISISGLKTEQLKENEKTLAKLLDQSKQEMTTWATKKLKLEQDTERLRAQGGVDAGQQSHRRTSDRRCSGWQADHCEHGRYSAFTD